MPATTSWNAGGGWATWWYDASLGGPDYPQWCYIDWKNVWGYTGCWRLYSNTFGGWL